MPGPPRTPTAKLAKRGSWRAKIRDGEPETIKNPPALPQSFALTDEMERLWDGYVQMLAPIGCIGEQDGITLYRLVVAAAEFAEAVREVEASGRIITGHKGKKYKNPWIQIRNDASAELARLERSFGLSPATRASLDVGPKEIETIGKVT